MRLYLVGFCECFSRLICFPKMKLALLLVFLLVKTPRVCYHNVGKSLESSKGPREEQVLKSLELKHTVFLFHSRKLFF